MNNIDAKNFLFTLLKVDNGLEDLQMSITEAEARLSEKDIEHVKQKIDEIKKSQK
jgi:septation ring formation regulator EzrA